MAIIPFLAMTATEMRKDSRLPPKVAWMACHFSPYGQGLSNLPTELPPQSMIILDDSTPLRGHDPKTISDQLSDCLNGIRISGILLDFQRPGNPETAALTKHLIRELPCPIIVSDHYAEDLSCPVFLPPVPPSVPLPEHISLWKGRDIWLEIGLPGETLTLTKQGCKTAAVPYPDISISGFSEETLHCHYTITTNEKSASFTLWRTMDDLTQLMEEAATLGITDFIGLYQELGQE